MPRSKGRTGGPWRRCVAQVRAWVRDHGEPCWLCGHPIDLGLDSRHPHSFTVDHAIPLSLGGAPRDLGNLRPAHRFCNLSRGSATKAKPKPPTSRVW